MNSLRIERPTSKRGLALARCVALGSSALCGLAVGLGTYPDVTASAGPMNFVLPFALAPVIAFGLAASWHFVLGLAAHANELHKQAIAVGLGVALFSVGCGTSAWFLCSKLGGASALQAYQLDHVQKLKDAAEIVAVNSASEQGLISAVDAGATALRATAEAEGSTGLLSGRAGKSVVYQSLMNAAQSVSAMSRSLKQQAEDRDEGLTRAEHNLSDASRAVAARNAAQFEEHVARAASQISAADKVRLTAAASGLGVGLVVADKARPAVDMAFAEIGRAAHGVGENRRDVSVPIYVPIGAKEAVITNPPTLAWIASILIEALPFAMLGILLALWREERDGNNELRDGDEPLPATLVPPTPRARPTLAAAE